MTKLTAATARMQSNSTICLPTPSAWPCSRTAVVIAPGPASIGTASGVIASTGALPVTTTMNDCVSNLGGTPLSVTRTVMVLVPI